MTVVRRYEFSDRDWAEIEPLLPKQERGGKWNDHRTVMNGMFWVLRSVSGARFRSPDSLGTPPSNDNPRALRPGGYQIAGAGFEPATSGL